MAATALIIAAIPAVHQLILRTAEATGLFTNCLSATDEHEALCLLRERPVDLIFCEIPHSTKVLLKLERELQSHENWREIPVVALLREDKPGLRLLGLELGAQECLPYGASSRELVLRCRRLLQGRQRMENLRLCQERLARLALTDALTGVFNRAYFDATLEQETARSLRTGRPLSLLLLDLDHFKRINDTFGHGAGDQVLREVAQTLAGTFRKSDTVCRYGGEEFAVILPETPVCHAATIAERVRRIISELPMERPVTVSIGLACAMNLHATLAGTLLERADRALYAAKAGGRNRVAAWEEGSRELHLVTDFNAAVNA